LARGVVKDFFAKIPLIGVGPARTGSTWLYHVLADTKLVERPNTKEVSYFDKNYDKQIAWYRNNFTNTGKDYWIDVTPHYIESLLHCERIHEKFPNAYILLGIRDPIERIKSLLELFYYNTKSRKGDGYERYLEDDYEGYLKDILHKQIIIGDRVAFFRRMYQDRLVVIRYEALKSDPVACAKEILSRCGIVAPPPPTSNYVINSLYTLKKPRLMVFSTSLFRVIRTLLPPALAWHAKVEIGERLLMQKVQLEGFLGEKEFQRIIDPHLESIDRDKRMVEEILGTIAAEGATTVATSN
jgi:hypothetical protein